jgi:hypothetical protein
MNRYANINQILTVKLASFASFYRRCFCVLFGSGHPSSEALTHRTQKTDIREEISRFGCDWTAVLKKTIYLSHAYFSRNMPHS